MGGNQGAFVFIGHQHTMSYKQDNKQTKRLAIRVCKIWDLPMQNRTRLSDSTYAAQNCYHNIAKSVVQLIYIIDADHPSDFCVQQTKDLKEKSKNPIFRGG